MGIDQSPLTHVFNARVVSACDARAQRKHRKRLEKTTYHQSIARVGLLLLTTGCLLLLIAEKRDVTSIALDEAI